MAAMSTALTEFSDKENSRTYTYTGHTASKPKLVLQKRKVATGNQVVIEDSIAVIAATVDAASLVLPQKISFEVIVRRPITGASADVTAALAIFRDVVAGDEFTATVNGQTYLKN